MNAQRDERLSDLIASSFLFKTLDDRARAWLEERAARASFGAGDLIIQEDEEGRELYIVDSGRVKVTMLSTGGDVELAELGPGAVVGEVAVLSGGRRTTTVEALEDVEAISFSAETIRELVEAHPRVGDLMERIVEGRARHTVTLLPNS